MAETIFALSSGAPPAAIGLIRVSGPAATASLEAICGKVPAARHASFVTMRDGAGAVLDRGLALWFPGPNTATGEDLAEFHCHGGRAVIAAVMARLAELPGLRAAEPGEFTRRAFANGRIDLAEAEGLADLLTAETELQRRAAIAMAGGAFSRVVADWRDRVLVASAEVEAVLDFADEDDAAALSSDFASRLHALARDIAETLARPRAEKLREGYKVVIAGPPNAGKSTLFNALVEEEAAITAPVAGTTRDVLERPVAIGGVPFLFSDTAGLHAGTGDMIEAIGMERAHAALESADLVLWLGPEGEGPSAAWEIAARSDCADAPVKRKPRARISAVTGEGIGDLRDQLVAHALSALPKPGDVAVNQRQSALLEQARDGLRSATQAGDPLIVAEGLRQARAAFDRLLGHATAEDMLDALFGRFCIGK